MGVSPRVSTPKVRDHGSDSPKFHPIPFRVSKHPDVMSSGISHFLAKTSSLWLQSQKPCFWLILQAKGLFQQIYREVIDLLATIPFQRSFVRTFLKSVSYSLQHMEHYLFRATLIT